MATRVYIGRLPQGVRERDIEKFFKGYGRLREILLKGEFGFVEFEDHRDADDAVYELNGRELLGDRIICEFARKSPKEKYHNYDRRDGGRDRDGGRYGRDRGDDRYDSHRPPQRSRRSPPRDRFGPPTRTDYRVIVENLSSRCSWQDLKDHFRDAGEITFADAHKIKSNEGVVEFASYKDMKTALDKLDGMDINGRKVRLVEDRGNYFKDHGRDRSRSRSRSRSLHRSRSHKSRSRSRRKSVSRSRSKESSKNSVNSASRSRSRTASGSKSRSASPMNGASRSRSRSPSASVHEKSKSRSRSRSNDD